ncbi:hypothetical protein GCM10020358_59720 [Amorphoplanes nipponensis]|uniref:O-antigen ligase-related domain-containing protein n=2 Tax=Actinoplanes nipponensis TaxID=135950 RepID=A0A919JCQ0_9ACTN|nr:hypothetical protein Ani05nite_04840 [Actinoplanes nipponensis]
MRRGGAYAGIVVLGVLAGAAFACQPLWTVGALAAASFVAITLHRFAWGVALWVPSFFVAGDPRGKALLMAGFVVCSLVWVADVLARRRAVLAGLGRFRPWLLAVPAFAVWLVVTLAWAQDPPAAIDEEWRWMLAIEVFMIVLTGVTRAADMLLVLVAWVAGAAVAAASALLSFQSGGQLGASNTLDDRLAGAAGDPNYLASRLIAGMILVFGLLRVVRSRTGRVLLVLTLPLLGAATAGTGSRGGLLAVVLAGVVALVVFRHKARVVLIPALAVLASGALWFALFPQFWLRVTEFDDGGSGRSDLWRAATRLASGHPAAGIGLGNFPSREAALALDIGPVLDARALAEDRRVVHNTYLQLWTETGAIGLALFLIIVGGCVWCCLRAARTYDRLGQARLADLSRVVVVAVAAFAGSAMFISMGRAYEFWVLFALGPVLLAVAHARTATAAPRPNEVAREPAR